MGELEIYKGIVKKMKDDEIKEILEKLKDGNWYDVLDLTGTMWIELKWEETHLLLDYITNLQQENERLKGSITAIKHNYNLLTTLIENGESMTQKFENGLTQKDYKSRIEKAVEYINCNKQKIISAYGDNEDDDFEICLWEEDIDDLLEILNGKE